MQSKLNIFLHLQSDDLGKKNPKKWDVPSNYKLP